MKNNKKTITLIVALALLLSNIVIPDNYIVKSNIVIAAENENLEENTTTEISAGEESSSEFQEESTEAETSTEDDSENLSDETSSGDETSEDETTTENITTPEETTTEFIIINEVYKVKDGVLVEYLGDKGDESITELIIPAQITTITDKVFADSQYIESVSFEEGSLINSLGEYVFYNCAALKTVNLPEGIVDIGYRTFAMSMKIKSLYIPKSVTKGRQIVGKNSAVTTVEFAIGTTKIPKSILRYADTVKTVKMYSGITSIGEYAFEGCSSLTTMGLPNTIVYIKEGSFKDCKHLSTMLLPTSLKSIENEAFSGCTMLGSLEIKKTVTSIGVNAFYGDVSLVLQVYANSYGKKYAIQYGINWEYAPSELLRQQKSMDITTTFEGLIAQGDLNKYKLKYLKNYVPQGTCVVKNYVVVSMYHKSGSKKSILVIYKRSTGEFVKKVKLEYIDHVGAVTNVENRIVVSLNNISATDYVGVINYKTLKNAKAGKVMKFDYKIKLPGYADFAAYDGKHFWAGRSANISNASLYGYYVKIKKKKLTFTKKFSFIVPANTQGMVAIKGKGGNREFVLTQSYGRLADSYIYSYNLDVNTATSLGTPEITVMAPSMIQGIAKYKKYVYINFESAAYKYCSDPNNTSEIQMKNVAKIKYSDLGNLYKEVKE